MLPPRLAALCGIAAPTAFVAAWTIGGVRTDGYDPVEQAISQLAREGAETRVLMTSGLVAFGVLLPLWAKTVAQHLDAPWLRWTVTTAGLSTLAVAALPLTRDPGGTQDALHAVAAGTGYVAMAATPLVAAAALRGKGKPRAAAASLAVGLVSAAGLVGTVALPDVSGGMQRLGLTVVDAWHVVVAAAVLRRH
jgi:hypothetical membrane protein